MHFKGAFCWFPTLDSNSKGSVAPKRRHAGIDGRTDPETRSKPPLPRSSPLPRLDDRNPLRYRGQRREVGVRRALIPIPRRIEVIDAIVGVTVLHGVLHIALEGH